MLYTVKYASSEVQVVGMFFENDVCLRSKRLSDTIPSMSQVMYDAKCNIQKTSLGMRGAYNVQERMEPTAE